jgi:hypothetical protein
MNPNDFGRKLGIGLRVAGRIAQQRVEGQASNPPAQQPSAQATSAPAAESTFCRPAPRQQAPQPDYTTQSKEALRKSRNITRAAGRGIGGFLRPFGRVGGILWLEVTGFFFGLIALFFAFDLWKVRLSYARGPEHMHFLLAVGATLLFAYLCISAFWRAGRK